MNTRTRLIIGITVIAIGAGVVSLGFIDQESDIRRPQEILLDPDAHREGTYTLMGESQPAMVPVIGPNGTNQIPNDEYQNHTEHVVRWGNAFSTIRIDVHSDDTGSHWTLTNTTRYPGTNQTPVITTDAWHMTGPHHIFQIESFETGDRLWGVYEGVFTKPLERKPGQFQGRLASSLADHPLHPDAHVYIVEEYTAGCSSKFLPPEVAEEYADDPDVY